MSARLGQRSLGAIAASVVALWLSYAVTTGLMPAARHATAAPSAHRGTPTALELTRAPQLRARQALFTRIPAPAIALPAPAAATRRAATPASATRAPAPMSEAPVPATTTAPEAPAQETPAQRGSASPPARKQVPKPTLTERPTKPSTPDFDDASPAGFDSSG